MEKEKKYIGKWYIWIVFLLIITSIVLWGLSSLGIWGKTIIERKVFEQSYQKKTADEDALSTYDAQISILKRRLTSVNITEQEKNEIQAQIDSINILKSSKGN